MRLIDADAVCAACRISLDSMASYCDEIGRESCVVTKAPTVYAVPVVHGRWIAHDDEWGLTCECSNCHVEGMLYGKFCPQCGAKMDEEE